MIARLAAIASPLLAKAVLILGSIILTLGTFASIQTWRIGQLKDDAALAQAQAIAAAATARATVNVLNAERAAADAATQAAIDQALAEQPAQVRTITRTVERLARESPQFADARRPAELAAFRVQQLQAVDHANGHRLP